MGNSLINELSNLLGDIAVSDNGFLLNYTKNDEKIKLRF